MQVSIKKVQYGINEDGVPIIGPAEAPPAGFVSCEITEDAYVYILDVPEQEPGSND